MPLARIITDSVDESLELTMQLRSRGFQVETVAPGNVPNTPADLEVRLEECDSEDVLTRTAQVSEADDLWVFVAPGALDERVRPMRTIPLYSAPLRGSDAKPVPLRRANAAPAVLPFAVPEDDPILLELYELNQRIRAVEAEVRPANGNGAQDKHLAAASGLPAAVNRPAAHPGNGTAYASAVEISSGSADVVVFPSPTESKAALLPAAEPVASDALRRGSDWSPNSSADLRFWRIACITAVLAIGALLIGVNLSRTPELPGNAPRTVPPVAAASSKPPHSAQVAPANSKSATSAKPPAGAPTKSTALQGPVKLASKTVRLHKAPTGRSASPVHDEIIANDTVVYFDRNGHRLTRKPDKHRSDLN
jgi:hypothetical protein